MDTVKERRWTVLGSDVPMKMLEMPHGRVELMDKPEPFQFLAGKDTKSNRCSPAHMVKPMALEEYLKTQTEDERKAHSLLMETADILGSRGKERDKEEGERTIPQLVPLFNQITGHKLSNEDGWLFMLMLKLVRMRGGSFKDDDYLDAIGYAALMAEQSIKDND